jgi:hypothetical protein
MVSYNDWEETILKKVFLPRENLTEVEKEILTKSYDIFMGRISDIRAMDDDIRRLTEKVLNLKLLNEELIRDLEELKKQKNGK